MRDDAFLSPDPPQGPWGLAATAGLGLVIWYTLVLLQAAMMQSTEGVFRFFRITGEPPQGVDGLSVAVVTCTTAVLCAALVIAAARLRHAYPTARYLGLVAAPWPLMLRWLGAMLVVVIQVDLVLYLVKGELLPAYWIELYRTSWRPGLLWVALIIAVPVFEELFFRGFLFDGIRASRLGPRWAIGLTALAWALSHQQHDPLEFAIVLILGVVLGIARLRTGSIRVTIAMHALHNLISMLELAWLTRTVPG